VRRGFAAAPEAKTMAMIDGGFVEGAIAEIRAAEERAAQAGSEPAYAGQRNQGRASSPPPQQPPPAGDADGPTSLEQPRVPIPTSTDEIGRSATLPADGLMSPFAAAAPPLHVDQPTSRAPHQPFPSGELLVPPHGTPPGTTTPQQDMSLPVHHIGMPPPPPGYYPPQQQGWGQGDWTAGVPYRKKLPPWALPLAFMLAIILATGLTVALARAIG
jgi:hypothetical protein